MLNLYDILISCYWKILKYVYPLVLFFLNIENQYAKKLYIYICCLKTYTCIIYIILIRYIRYIIRYIIDILLDILCAINIFEEIGKRFALTFIFEDTVYSHSGIEVNIFYYTKKYKDWTKVTKTSSSLSLKHKLYSLYGKKM